MRQNDVGASSTANDRRQAQTYFLRLYLAANHQQFGFHHCEDPAARKTGCEKPEDGISIIRGDTNGLDSDRAPLTKTLSHNSLTTNHLLSEPGGKTTAIVSNLLRKIQGLPIKSG
jgi:hypothetical protein